MKAPARRSTHELGQDVEVLRNIPLFAKVEPEKLKLLAFTSERLEYMSGDELFHQGDYGDAAYIILEGEANVLVDTRPGRGQGRHPRQERHHRRDRGPVRRAAHRDGGRAQRAETLRVSKRIGFHLVTQFPQVGVEVMSELASRLHHTTQALTAARAKLDELDKRDGGG